MERFILANILADIDFELLISDSVRNIRGCWGEIMEIRFPEGVIFAYIDENNNGFIKIYQTADCKKVEEFAVTKDNLHGIMKNSINNLKG